ncbi:MAG TPA: gamma-glutamyltransferase [Tenuifilaceae bacterium]|nr:gamma-glutamyltransferase [Tenuifilaceae bacterium]HPJ46665.1 gamma-glutamyltransferase [Tenuifilaceae bacterium]HPQ35209.1 gamma-glutamyltransferase [Tenuifilaceae bacterium]HRX69168.1 gamma-glutamyltransferase [Tenuifilaceae bacterium]
MKRNSLILLFVMGIGVSLAQDRITGHNFATRSEVIAQNGMAATSHPLATQVAVDILKMGGTAVDAAIAANAVLGLMEPTGCGVGGDLFAIVWDAKTQKLYGLNASGRSPKSLTLDYFRGKGIERIPSFGPLPVTVPGAVDGWFELHSKFGKLPMVTILNPAINYAREGFPVTELIAFYLERSVRVLGKYPNFKETYLPNGKMPAKGDIFKNPDLANTYEIIANEGRDAFYKGEIAQAIASYIKEQGGFLSYEDFESHKSEWVEPVSTNYRGYDIWELPPNGQGIAALQILNILEGFDIASMGFGSEQYLHHFVEAKKLAFEDRAHYYADPQTEKVPVEKLISKEYAAERRKLINPEKAARRIEPGNMDTPSTIYLTVADKEGNMVSLIQSNYRGMGSGMTPYGLGFVLQDRGEAFNLEEGFLNTYAPGKRPFHTIIPAFITKDGKPYVSFGVMGGAMQPQGHAQIVINLIDFGMNLQEAGDAPRIQHDGSSEPTGEIMTNGGIVLLESGFSWEVIRELMKKGHKVQWDLGSYGGYQAIMWDENNGVYYGASESRKDGQAAGW